MDLILLGAPGAGKGTQGALLATRLGIPKIATGDVLRDAVRQGTELGLEAKRYMDAGELVPDAVILGLVEAFLDSPVAAGGAIFDGFPRTAGQAVRLGEMLERRGRKVDAVVSIEVPEDVIVRRMSGRRTDPETGVVYHLEHNPPPADVASRLVQRPDDCEETVRHRQAVYRTSTEPLIGYYRGLGVPLYAVDGDREIETVQAELLSRLDAPVA